MQYLIIYEKDVPYYTDWYSYENNYLDGMIVIDVYADKYTINGLDWYEIEEDHL